MRLIFYIFALFTYSFAQEFNFNSIKSDFVQTITSPENSSIIYEGQFFAKKPDFALWQYYKPTIKSIYIKDKEILIAEPELEQVIISKLEKSPNISAILNSATKVSNNLYKATYEETIYHIEMQNNLPKKITYQDKLDNNVTLLFKNPKINITLDKNLFKFQIPTHYDIIQN